MPARRSPSGKAVKARPDDRAAWLVTPEARKHGEYREAVVSVGPGEVEGVAHGNHSVVRNCGATTLDRWRPGLSADQASAIDLYVKCWHLFFSEARVSASYSPTASIRTTGSGVETMAARRIRAKQTLDLIGREVFARFPKHWSATFQNVVIHDMSASDAGRYLSQSTRGAQHAARTAVVMIADQIGFALAQSNQA